MTFLSAEQILGSDDIEIKEIDVPEWGGTVRVRGMTGVERDRFEFQASLARQSGGIDANFRAAVVGRCLVDGEGARLFGDSDITKLGGKSAAALDRLFDVARDLSGMTDEHLRRTAQNLGVLPNGASRSG